MVNELFKFLWMPFVFKDQTRRKFRPLLHFMTMVHMVTLHDHLHKLSKVLQLKKEMCCIVLYIVIKLLP